MNPRPLYLLARQKAQHRQVQGRNGQRPCLIEDDDDNDDDGRKDSIKDRSHTTVSSCRKHLAPPPPAPAAAATQAIAKESSTTSSSSPTSSSRPDPPHPSIQRFDLLLKAIDVTDTTTTNIDTDTSTSTTKNTAQFAKEGRSTDEMNPAASFSSPTPASSTSSSSSSVPSEWNDDGTPNNGTVVCGLGGGGDGDGSDHPSRLFTDTKNKIRRTKNTCTDDPSSTAAAAATATSRQNAASAPSGSMSTRNIPVVSSPYPATNNVGSSNGRLVLEFHDHRPSSARLMLLHRRPTLARPIETANFDIIRTSTTTPASSISYHPSFSSVAPTTAQTATTTTTTTMDKKKIVFPTRQSQRASTEPLMTSRRYPSPLPLPTSSTNAMISLCQHKMKQQQLLRQQLLLKGNNRQVRVASAFTRDIRSQNSSSFSYYDQDDDRSVQVKKRRRKNSDRQEYETTYDVREGKICCKEGTVGQKVSTILSQTPRPHKVLRQNQMKSISSPLLPPPKLLSGLRPGQIVPS